MKDDIHKPNVLYIDDEEDNLIGFKYMFKKYWNVQVCLSAEEAMQLVQETYFDVIIADQLMPGMSGVSFFENTLKRCPETIRIILTGYADFDAVIDAINKGHIYYYLQKPWDEEEVKLIVSNALENQRLERSIIENEKRFRDIAESSGDWIWEIDQKREIQYSSEKVTNILEYTPDELVGKNLYELISPQDKNNSSETLEALIQTLEPIKDLEVLTETKSGNQVYLIKNGFPIINDKNECLGYRGVDKDITEYKRIQKELIQSEKLKVIGQLTSGIAHDFNNQLTGIIGNAELLLSQLTNNEQIDLLHKVIISATRASGLTKQLLSYSRKETSVKKPVHLEKIITEVTSILGRSIDKKISIDTQFPSDDTFIFGDATRLQNAFLNLGINARDAITDTGTITFSVTKECNSTIHISVKDTGSGMSRAIKEKALDPFFTTKPEGKGTGMGLASVVGTIKNHDGSLEIHTQEGEGTEIVLTLPACDANCLVEEKEQETKEVKGSGTIMLIDDEPMLREVAHKILTELGYKPILCSNGKEAIEKYKTESEMIDLVICDQIMPEMSGLETIHELKTVNRNIKAILTSGIGIPNTLDELKKKGIKWVLHKPYTIAEISKAISLILKTK